MSPWLVAAAFAAPAAVQVIGVLLARKRPRWTLVIRSRWALLEGGPA